MRTSWGAWGFIVVSGCVLSGCPNPNTYGTPRTTQTGKVSHTIAAEGFGFQFDDPDSEASVSATVPTLPTYQLRYGITDRVDFGARVANLTSLGGDVKWNFLRTPVFDMAVDPGFQWYQLTINEQDLSVVYLHGPVLLGVNVAEPVSIVLSPGVTYAFASGSVETTDDRQAATSSDGLMARLGLGLDFRISDGFALHPEVTFMKSFRDDGMLLYMLGLGVNFGNLPSFADTAGRPAPPPAER